MFCGLTSRCTICWLCTYDERLAAVADVLDRVAERQPRIAAALEDRAQVDAVDEVHDDVEALVVAGVVEHLDHARVAQAREQARLDLEARGVTDVQQALDGDVGAGLAIDGTVNRTHRPTGNGRDDLIAPVERFPPDGCRLLIGPCQGSITSPHAASARQAGAGLPRASSISTTSAARRGLAGRRGPWPCRSASTSSSARGSSGRRSRHARRAVRRCGRTWWRRQCRAR